MTVISADRPGLVEQIAGTVAAHGGNWLESRMCRLGGQFAGIIRVEVEAAGATALADAVRALEGRGISVVVKSEAAAGAAAKGTLATFELVGHDRPGILLQISHVLATHGVNVEDLTSERVSAPMDGAMLFQARARVLVPPTVTLADLRANLERIATDLMVDVALLPARS